MIQDMCQEAGIEGQKTNHRLKVRDTTALYSAGVPEKIVQARTGHSSLEALRKYGRVTMDQELAISKLLTGESESINKASSITKRT